jgi:hypothetical protein
MSLKCYCSRLQYCANDSDCSDLGYQPPSDNVCVKKSSGNEEEYHTWEGGSQSCTFPTGVTFSWNIPPNAQSLPDYSYIGCVVGIVFIFLFPSQL